MKLKKASEVWIWGGGRGFGWNELDERKMVGIGGKELLGMILVGVSI